MKSLTYLIAILGLLIAVTNAESSNDEEPTRKRTLDHMISRVMKRGSSFSHMISRVMRSDPDSYNSYVDQLNVSSPRVFPSHPVPMIMKLCMHNLHLVWKIFTIFATFSDSERAKRVTAGGLALGAEGTVKASCL